MKRNAILLSFVLLAVFLICVGVKNVLSESAKTETPQRMFLKEIGCEKALIINADDLGRSEWSNEAILKGFNEGILTSTSIMTADLYVNEAYELVKANPKLDVGVHLTLARDDTPGHEYGPLVGAAKVPHLVDANGWFLTTINHLATVPQDEMDLELSAQVKAAYDRGVDVTHLDCHKGFYHAFDKKSLAVAIKLAKQYDLPLRWAGRPSDLILKKNGIVVTDGLNGDNLRDTVENRKKSFLSYLNNLKPGLYEYYFHPATGGFDENEAVSREGELSIVLDPEVKQAIKDNGICLVGYKQLRDFQRKLRKENSTMDK